MLDGIGAGAGSREAALLKRETEQARRDLAVRLFVVCTRVCVSMCILVLL